MASSTQHATIGRHLTTSTDAAVANRCMYTDDHENRFGAIIQKVIDANGVSVDLLVIDNNAKTTYMRYGVQHSIDHKNVNTWDWT